MIFVWLWQLSVLIVANLFILFHFGLLLRTENDVWASAAMAFLSLSLSLSLSFTNHYYGCLFRNKVWNGNDMDEKEKICRSQVWISTFFLFHTLSHSIFIRILNRYYYGTDNNHMSSIFDRFKWWLLVNTEKEI